MALHLSPKTQAHIVEKLSSGDYPDADAMLEQALTLLEEHERLLQLRELLAEGTKDVAQGKVREFTPARREELWEEALRQGESHGNGV